METMWGPHENHMLSMSKPHCVHMKTTCCLHANHVVYTWEPYGVYMVNHIVSTWKPHGVYVDKTWFPYGQHVVTMLTQCGYHMVSRWTPYGFYVDTVGL